MALYIRNYLKGEQYGTGDWKTILSYWDDVVSFGTGGSFITDRMAPYFRQMGYPVLKIKMEDNKLIITTRRFMAVDTDKMMPESEYKYLWDVPLV